MEYVEVRRDKISEEIREYILDRDRYSCRYCGSRKSPFHLDHVYPVSKGGETTISNLVTSCSICNQRKHNSIGMWPKPVGYFERERFRKFWVFWSHVFLGTLLTILSLLLFSETNIKIQNLGFAAYFICWIPLLVGLAKSGWYSTLELWRNINNES